METAQERWGTLKRKRRCTAQGDTGESRERCGGCRGTTRRRFLVRTCPQPPRRWTRAGHRADKLPMKRLWFKRIVWGVTLVAMTGFSAWVGRSGGRVPAGVQEGTPWAVRWTIIALASVGVIVAVLRMRRLRH